MNPDFNRFKKIISHSWKFRWFMFNKLPAALFAGLALKTMNEESASVSVKYKWFNQNPFRSMYFAVQAMAAEMSTGLLASAQVYRRNPPVSMLVVGLEARFYKRATGKIIFSCYDGIAIETAVEEAIKTGEGKILTCKSIGTNEAGEEVSEFLITWSFKSKLIS
ncbi:MAG: hypothetical protein RLZZ28_1906 [Bacteroidota bacterium]|jgi:hypothetical protein